MIMRIFFLDDDHNRIQAFLAWLQQSQITFTTLVVVVDFQEASNVLQSAAKFDVVFLDHDIADESKKQNGFVTTYGWSAFTGADVARVIAGLSDHRKPGTAIVHSWNPDGAANIIDILDKANIKRIIRWPFNPQHFEAIEKFIK